MTLAARMGLSQRSWYPPSTFLVAAFAVGMQIALIVQAIGPTSYPPPGKGVLAWTSLALLAAIGLLHVPTDAEDRQAIERWWRSVKRKLTEQRRRMEPPEPQPAGTNGHPPAPEAPATQEPAPRLKVRVHSPLMVGPVVAPGETVPIQVQAGPEELARELEVTFEVDHGGKTQRTTAAMQGTDLVHTETFDQPGPFEVVVTVRHPQSDPASKTLEGRVATYREEVGRLFDALKAAGIEAGMDVGHQSTPRELCKALPAFANASYEDAEALRTNLEIALYGDGQVDRATYEAIHTIASDLGLPTDPEEVQA